MTDRKSRRRMFEIKTAESPRLFIRAWRLVVMWWPNEPLLSRLEIVWG